jgi:hypothetical protein
MKVYIVILENEYEWDGFSIKGVFDSREKAEAHREQISKTIYGEHMQSLDYGNWDKSQDVWTVGSDNLSIAEYKVT